MIWTRVKLSMYMFDHFPPGHAVCWRGWSQASQLTTAAATTTTAAYNVREIIVVVFMFCLW